MLNEERLAFFARNGFLQLKNGLNLQTCRDLIDLTHQRLPSSWDPQDSSTWLGEVQDSCHTAPLDWFKGALKFQAGDLIDHPLIAAHFDPGTPIADMAGQMLGAPLAPLRTRGLYPIFPVSDPAMPARKPHIEGHPAELILFAYLDDVPPEGAGLSVWPGSHRDLYPAMSSKLDFEATEQYAAAYRKWAFMQPIELHGSKGDLIFTHHRLLHGPSVNRSSSVRYAFLCDYKRASHVEMAREAPAEDMWADWPAIAALPAQARDGAPDYALEPKPRVKRRPAPQDSRNDMASKKNVSTILKGLRHEEDIWIHVSDEVDRGVKILPRGSDLNALGVQLWVNDLLVVSPYGFDLFHRLDDCRPVNSIRVTGARRPLYIRAVRMKLPYVDSQLLGFWEIAADTPEAIVELSMVPEMA